MLPSACVSYFSATLPTTCSRCYPPGLMSDAIALFSLSCIDFPKTLPRQPTFSGLMRSGRLLSLDISFSHLERKLSSGLFENSRSTLQAIIRATRKI